MAWQHAHVSVLSAAGSASAGDDVYRTSVDEPAERVV